MGLRFVEIRSDSWEELRDLQRLHGLDVFGRTARRLEEGGFEIQGLLSDEQVERLRAAGYRVAVLRDADGVARERLRDLPHPPAAD